MVDELETGQTGSVLDEALGLHRQFTEGKVVLLPMVHGYAIYRRGHGLMSKMAKRYFKIIPNQGVLLKLKDQDHSSGLDDEVIDYYNLSKKEQEKMGVEVFKLIEIRGPQLNRSTRPEFEKRHQYALELMIKKTKTENTLIYLIFNDVVQLDQWQNSLEKSIEFSIWLKQVISFVKENEATLTAALKHKMTETLLFIQSFDSSRDQIEIQFVENYLKVKAEKAKKKKPKIEEHKEEEDEASSDYGSEPESNKSSMSKGKDVAQK